jgi:SynChlorMet cassette radical SAM/SPASM protein ScmF
MAVTREAPPLRCFYVYLTSGCNCACRHCWIVPEEQAAPRFLAPDLLRRAIEQALPLGLQSLKWTGGEPTLHPAFPELLAMQREYRLTASLETNGLLIDGRLTDLLQSCGVTGVSVSLDGATAATHDAIRGVQGGFVRTCRGIETLVAGGYRPELILTLQRSNLEEIPAYLELAARLGAGAVKINLVQPILRGDDLQRQGETLAVAEILLLARQLAAAAAPLPVHLDVPWAFRPLGGLLSGAAGGVCDLFHILGILPGGDYALCGIGIHQGELAFGPIMEGDLARLWREHPVLQALREGLPGRLQGICGACLMKGACRGSCVAANYRASGDLFAAHWFCRAAEAAGLFPAGRRC